MAIPRWRRQGQGQIEVKKEDRLEHQGQDPRQSEVCRHEGSDQRSCREPAAGSEHRWGAVRHSDNQKPCSQTLVVGVVEDQSMKPAGEEGK